MPGSVRINVGGQRIEIDRSALDTMASHVGPRFVDDLMSAMENLAANPALLEPAGMMDAFAAMLEEAPTAAAAAAAAPPPPPPKKQFDPAKDAPGHPACVACNDNQVAVSFACRHSVVCRGCFGRLPAPKLCPMCREPVRDPRELYFG